MTENPTFQNIAPPLRQPPMPTTIPDANEAIKFSLRGNISSRVSPVHVSLTRGFTPMRWALYDGIHNCKAV